MFSEYLRNKFTIFINKNYYYLINSSNIIINNNNNTNNTNKNNIKNCDKDIEKNRIKSTTNNNNNGGDIIHLILINFYLQEQLQFKNKIRKLIKKTIRIQQDNIDNNRNINKSNISSKSNSYSIIPEIINNNTSNTRSSRINKFNKFIYNCFKDFSINNIIIAIIAIIIIFIIIIISIGIGIGIIIISNINIIRNSEDEKEEKEKKKEEKEYEKIEKELFKFDGDGGGDSILLSSSIGNYQPQLPQLLSQQLSDHHHHQQEQHLQEISNNSCIEFNVENIYNCCYYHNYCCCSSDSSSSSYYNYYNLKLIKNLIENQFKSIIHKINLYNNLIDKLITSYIITIYYCNISTSILSTLLAYSNNNNNKKYKLNIISIMQFKGETIDLPLTIGWRIKPEPGD